MLTPEILDADFGILDEIMCSPLSPEPEGWECMTSSRVVYRSASGYVYKWEYGKVAWQSLNEYLYYTENANKDLGTVEIDGTTRAVCLAPTFFFSFTASNDQEYAVCVQKFIEGEKKGEYHSISTEAKKRIAATTGLLDLRSNNWVVTSNAIYIIDMGISYDNKG